MPAQDMRQRQIRRELQYFHLCGRETPTAQVEIFSGEYHVIT